MSDVRTFHNWDGFLRSYLVNNCAKKLSLGFHSLLGFEVFLPLTCPLESCLLGIFKNNLHPLYETIFIHLLTHKQSNVSISLALLGQTPGPHNLHENHNSSSVRFL